MPCRVCDVPGRVHIGVAGVSAGPAPVTRLALTRSPVHGATRRPGYGTDLQILDADHVEAPGQVRADLLQPVLAQLAVARFKTGDGRLVPAAQYCPPLVTLQLAQ